MAKRRHALNPAKVKADLAALDENPPPQAFRPRLDIRRRPSVLLLCLLSSVLLLVSFAPFDYWFLAYLSLVPLTAAAVGARNGRWALLGAYLAGAAFWAAGLYWLTWITPLGYGLLVVYLGLYWLAAAAALRAAFRRGWPMWLALPVAWVALEYARAFALSGFPWFFLAHSQHACTRLVQIADLTGQYGVSFFVALINGVIVDALSQPLFVKTDGGGRLSRRILTAAAAGSLSAAALIGYGSYRLGQNATRPGPNVGVVQLAFPISLSRPDARPQEIFDRHADMTARFVSAELDLVVWPESMLGFPRMRPSYWFDLDPNQPAEEGRPGLLYAPAEQELIRTYHRNLGRLQRLLTDLGCPLLGGGSMPAFDDEQLNSNSALLFDLDADGRIRLAGRYDKMHLVPFSESVPFRRSWPALHALLRRFVPEVMPQLAAGSLRKRFEIRASNGGGPFRFATPICYEGTFARVCRALAVQDGQKRIDLLVNLSNDGWFICVRSRGSHASAELAQHLARYVFRAVENRVPVIRAVNTGISAHIDSNGRLRGQVTHAGERKMVGGNLIARTLVDSRVSLYSLTGDRFAQGVCVVSVVGIAALFLRRARDRRKDRRR